MELNELRIVLADDHTLVRETVTELLERLAPKVEIFQADCLEMALEIAQSNRLQMAILDMVMPGMQGFDGVRQLHEICPELPVVILSGLAKQSDVVQALRLGAAGFIPKTIGGRGMLSALKMILSGETYVPPMVLSEIGHTGAEPAELASNKFQLTRREREVLQLLVTGKPNKVIAGLLDVQEVTIKAHLSKLFTKMGVSNRVEAVTMALNEELVSANQNSQYTPSQKAAV